MERGGEPTPGAVQADAGGVAGTAEDDGDLAGVEAFPAGQREDLAVGVAEAAERGRHPFQAGRRVAVVRLGRQFGPEPHAQRGAALLAAALVGEHPPGDPVQPRPGGLPGRNVVDPPPGGEEGLGDDVGGVFGVAGRRSA